MRVLDRCRGLCTNLVSFALGLVMVFVVNVVEVGVEVKLAVLDQYDLVGLGVAMVMCTK